MGRSTSNALFMVAGNAVSSLASMALKPLLHLRSFKTPFVFRFKCTSKGIAIKKNIVLNIGTYYALRALCLSTGLYFLSK